MNRYRYEDRASWHAGRRFLDGFSIYDGKECRIIGRTHDRDDAERIVDALNRAIEAPEQRVPGHGHDQGVTADP